MTRLLVVAAALVAVLAVGVVSGAGAEWDVYPGAGTPIQDAIDGAGAGDTIYVHEGTYIENVNVTKELEIRSESGNPNNVIVRAVDSYDHIFHVTADNVTVSGFRLEGAYGTIGIYLDGVHNNVINNNILSNNKYGINLHHSINNTLGNNTASNNVYGIYLDDSIYNNLSNNNANSNDGYGYCVIYDGYGIYLQNSSNNTLVNNVMSNNRHNFGASGSNMQNDIDDSNLVDGKPIYYFVNKSDIIVDSSSNPGVVYCINCQNISVKDLTIRNNGYGVYLYNTSNSNIDNNVLLNNEYGIKLYHSSNNTLSNNTASKNKCGIKLYHSSNNTLSNNTASNNFDGILLLSSSNNTLIDNIAKLNQNHCPHTVGSVANYGVLLYDSSNNTLVNNMLFNNRHNFGAGGGNMQNDIDDSNLVDGRPIYYFVNKSDIIVDSSSNPGVVYCINCQNISVKDLTIRNNGYGVYLYNTSNSNIDNNTLLNTVVGIYLIYSGNNTANSNKCGIKLYHSSNNTLSNNTASSINMWHSNNNVLSDNSVSNGNGIGLSRSSDNTLQGNTANSNNWNGIRLYYSSNNNTLYHNNLINNTPYNAYDTGTNVWDPGSEGNYYFDYNGTDNNTDGIGDTPYDIPGGSSVDRYPLMHPWTDTPPQKGDLNRDGILTPTDAAIALEIAVGSRPCDPTLLAAADVSGDGGVTSLDALMILQAAAGSIEIG